jgi:predicted nucleotidyltransferase
MYTVRELADELGAPERTLRRVVAVGALRSRRLSARRLRLADGELDYLRDHWHLLAELRRALRTEKRVRLAVLFGSTARGDNDESSDVDLLVEFADDKPLDRLRLGIRLGDKLGREVDVASRPRAERSDPFFLLQALDEGRVIVDRDGEWPNLRARRPAIYKRAMRAYRRRREHAAEALQDLPAAR